MNRGYVKVWRKVLDSPFYRNSEAVHLFLHMLLLASRVKRTTYNGTQRIELNPGQLVTGRKQLSEATGISESKVYRLLELLKNEQQIEQQTNSKFSIISITNWSLYQESEQQIEQQMNIKRTASEQQVNTKQEVKEVKNVEKGSKSNDDVSNPFKFLPPERHDSPLVRALRESHQFQKAWYEWIAYRKEIKKPLKPTTVAKQIGMLANHPHDVVIKSINQSIQSGWTGLFPKSE